MQFQLHYQRWADKRVEQFATEHEAIVRAVTLIRRGGYSDFRIDDHTGKTVATAADLRTRSRLPRAAEAQRQEIRT